MTGAAPATAQTDLLAQPHHDGSSLYVSSSAPALGETVQVYLRVPHDAEVQDVYVRTTPDAEPLFVQAERDRSDEVDTWFRADLVVHNPVTTYRFMLRGGAAGYQWFNGTGLHLRDVPDAADFRVVSHDAPPAWAADAVVYQVFPDRFARSAAADLRPVPDWALPARWDDPVLLQRDSIGRQLYGGDLDGIVEHLDHVQALGVNTVYLTPIFPARSNHRYDASTFDAVDPVLGGDEALTRLTDAGHARGIRVMGDFTTNHTGASHEWFEAAQRDQNSPEREFYFFADGDYVAWLGVKSLPKLNFDSAELRRRLFDDPKGVVRRLITEADLDGWRVDVANMTGRYRGQDHNHEVARLMRAAMADANPDTLLVAEHCHDYAGDVDGDGWHGVMNYAGFTRPVWTWLRAPGHAPNFLGAPLMVPRLGAASVMETIREFTAQVPWRSIRHSFNLVGSHDTTRVRSLVGDDPRHVDVAAGLLLTMPGIPMITYGDEIGMPGDFGEDGRRPMPWDQRRWDTRLLEVYRGLVRARQTSTALRHGGLRFVHADGDVLVYLRETAEEVALVHCARERHRPVRVPARRLPGVHEATALYGPDLSLDGDDVVLHADGPGVGVWAWNPAGGPARATG